MLPGHSAILRRVCLVLALCATAVLAACHHEAPPASNVTPEKAVATSLRLVATGDFDGLAKNRLPPADYAVWRAEWQRRHTHPRPVTDVQREQFAKIMQMLTEPGAEAALLKKLEAMSAGKGHLPPIFTSIAEAAGRQMIEDAPQLGPAQKKMALDGLAAVMAWAATVDPGDHEKAARAVDLVCSTARSLHIKTLAQWRALDYETRMRDYGIIWNGMENLLAIYGLDLGASLLDARASTVSKTGDEAVVRLDMQVAGKPLTGQWKMRRLRGHWYDQALLDAWRKAHPAPAGTAANAASAAPSAGAPASGTADAPPTPATAAAPASAPAPATASTVSP